MRIHSNFSAPGKAIVVFFVPNRRYKILTLRPSTGALNTCSALLERSRRLHRNKYRLYEIDPWLLWIFITKSQVPDGSLSLSMTPSDVERWGAIGQRARTVWLSDPILGNRCYAYTVSPRTTNLAQYRKSSTKEACFFAVDHGPATLESVPKYLGPEHTPTWYNIKSNQILQRDHKWEVTFYKVQYAPDTRSGA